MTPASTLSVLTELGITVTVRDGDLVLSGAAVRELKLEDLESIRGMKGDLIALLRPPPRPLFSPALLAQLRDLRQGRPDLSRDELVDTVRYEDRAKGEAALVWLEAEEGPATTRNTCRTHGGTMISKAGERSAATRWPAGWLRAVGGAKPGPAPEDAT